MNKNICWITLNNSCNLRCSWCYARDNGYTNVIMNQKLLMDIIDFCSDGGVKKVVLLGGEPTLYPYLDTAISYCKSKNINTEITTNGLLLADEPYLRKLKNCGLNSVMLSMKGYDFESYANTTGFEGYNQAILAIDNLVKTNTKFGVSCVLTVDFIDDIENLMDDLYSHKVPLIVFSLAKDYGVTEEAVLFREVNNPYKIIPLFYEKYIENKLLFDKSKWILELCTPIVLENKEINEFLNKYCHYSCKKNNDGGIIFDPYGNLLVCNTMPNVKLGKYGVDFLSYEEYVRYIK